MCPAPSSGSRALRVWRRTNGFRYGIALALGVRQGESLGFKRTALDKKRKTLRFGRQFSDRSGSTDATTPTRAARSTTRPNRARSPARSTRARARRRVRRIAWHTRECPQRHGGGLVEVDVKSRAGRRTWKLPDELFGLIERHEEQQQRAREHAGSESQEGGWMFTQPTGNPIEPRAELRHLVRTARRSEGAAGPAA